MAAQNAITLLDGGTGQELIARIGEDPRPLWSAWVMMERPDLVAAVHRDFIAAGAEVITLNTYSVTPRRLQRHSAGERFLELQQAAIEIAHRAREGAAHPVRLAGCLPPLVNSYVPHLAPNAADAAREYAELVAPQAPHVDIILAETMATITEAVAATRAGADSGLPIWTGLTVDDHDGHRLRSGEPLDEALDAVVEAGADALLLNCSRPEAIGAALPTLARHGLPFGAYANGFTAAVDLDYATTVDVLVARTDLGPAAYADHVDGWIAAGATIVGGCCETGPAHIAEIARRLGKPAQI
ncbi:MAG: homocysteine S-methyltransferase family protein [Pseudomonadota bacterium]